MRIFSLSRIAKILTTREILFIGLDSREAISVCQTGLPVRIEDHTTRWQVQGNTNTTWGSMYESNGMSFPEVESCSPRGCDGSICRRSAIAVVSQRGSDLWSDMHRRIQRDCGCTGSVTTNVEWRFIRHRSHKKL